MTHTHRALELFFGQFGLPAWPIGGVPAYTIDGEGARAKVRPPYIAYQLISPRWDAPMPFYAEVWYRATTYEGIDATVDAISRAIGEGVGIPTPDGVVYIHKGTSFCQYRDTGGDEYLKCAYLNMTIQAFTD